ncbi:MAG TPA: PKD domain-containing protein [Thermoanaerobaculia bacterium]
MLSLLLLCSAAFAGETATCGTSPAVDAQAQALHRHAARAVAKAANAAPTTRFADDVLYVDADQETVPFDDPADLEGMSLYFARRDDATFAVTRQPLFYDEDTGPLAISFGRGETSKVLPLTGFAFPFAGEAHTQLTLSVARGIHFEERIWIPNAAFDALDLMTQDVRLIAPLLDYVTSAGGRPEIYVKQTSGAVTITWRSQPGGHATYDIQAVLYASGDMRFAYKEVRNFNWGGVVVMTGRDEWKNDRTVVATLDDQTGELSPALGEARAMADLKELEISRIAGTSMLEFRFRLAAAIDRTTLPAGSSYLVFIGDSVNRIELVVHPDRLSYRLPQLGERPALAHIEGDEVVLTVTEELLAPPSNRGGTMRIWAHTNVGNVPADFITADVDFGTATAPFETDFSALTSVETARPLLETYRLGTVNVHGVWSRLKEEFGYRDDDIDAVAIYTSFLSDIIHSPYGAFATLSNCGADGVSQFATKSQPRTAMLMHMNSLMAFTSDDQLQILLHELGHRWLYYFRIMENGQPASTPNPKGYHPAQFVHTPAAFPVKGPSDSSVMGGAAFKHVGSGIYQSPAVSPFGFAWHELYLMGLAAAEEIQPWYYLTGTTLGDEYYPPSNVTVNANQVDVVPQQLIAAMGPRDPAYGKSQTNFRVLFVVLERPWSPANAALTARRTGFEQMFRTATGNRGTVSTSLSVAPPSAEFWSTATGATVTFEDNSTHVPLAWQWSFGDGQTSNARNPQHIYAAPGNYRVTLTVINGKGSASITKMVTVSGGRPRRRAAGRG